MADFRQWEMAYLREKNLTEKHNSKVYGKADIGSPPMSVPHLDTRWIDKKTSFFGPLLDLQRNF